MSTEPIGRGELAFWSAAAGGRKIHAFAQDPESAGVYRHVPLCRPGLTPNSSGSTFGDHCQECERVLRFLHAIANKYNESGERRGRALAIMGR
jgi:hypothetical protein